MRDERNPQRLGREQRVASVANEKGQQFVRVRLIPRDGFVLEPVRVDDKVVDSKGNHPLQESA
jgi:hypothetical protein